MSKASELTFQSDIISQMLANGWLLGKSANYNRELALYPEDVLGFVQDTQKEQWKKFCALYPVEPEQKFLERVAAQLNKADPNAANKEMRTFGTLGVLRHELRDRGTRFSLCQFAPEHDLNPDTLARYQQNRLRVVPELVYSPWLKALDGQLDSRLRGNDGDVRGNDDSTGDTLDSRLRGNDGGVGGKAAKTKAWRIDLVLFVNGIPVATLELKSEFKQAVEIAMQQYRTTRLPVDPASKKPEPLLTFKRGALVHFAVSQYEVYMSTRLAGEETVFLPFNKGTSEGGAGNDVPEVLTEYATEYLWNEVLLPKNLLTILARYVHLQIDEKEDWEGRKYKKESLIFPRYHQWDVVNKLLKVVRREGPGQKYLIQHSAGSGKSNSIAWAAHQLSSLYDAKGNKLFHSVIVVTDRTVLDAQLQDTIAQFEHADGVVGRINNQEGDGSKSEKLAKALEGAQPIIIVTIQTFPWVLKAIENSLNLKTRNYAVIADEAHSSQTGSTARQLKEVLMLEAADQASDEAGELSTDDILDAAVASRRASKNLSYLAFTATPKARTLELFGRLPFPLEAPSKTNIPTAFHVYSMRQAIEEKFILDVLKNYTNYKVAYNLAMKLKDADQEVESKRAKVRLNQWVRLHDYNISQKVQVIVEHFKNNVAGLLGGQAKAMVVTSSRKEAVRYKQAFDKYISTQGYQKLHAMVAFSGEVEFGEKDPPLFLNTAASFPSAPSPSSPSAPSSSSPSAPPPSSPSALVGDPTSHLTLRVENDLDSRLRGNDGNSGNSVSSSPSAPPPSSPSALVGDPTSHLTLRVENELDSRLRGNDGNSGNTDFGIKYTETTMNPLLKGRDMRRAFDTDDYQVMIVANKFQTGFDQPKLCAMYVDKKLAGVECVQTLSRLNRVYPGKRDTGTYILDFFNEPEDILSAFQPYFQTAELADVSDPNLIFDLYDKLRAAGIFTWTEVEQFCDAFFVKSKSNAAIANICKPAVQRWQQRYKLAVDAYKHAREMFERSKKTADAVLIANAENSFKECKRAKDALEIFKKDLGTFVRFYEFMSQIVDYDDKDLEKLSLYARNLRPMLRETMLEDDDVDLSAIVLSHYRVSKIRQQDLLLRQERAEYKLEPVDAVGTARAKDKKVEFLSQIVQRLNELFITDHLTDNDFVNYAWTIRDKVSENSKVMQQIANNSAEQALLGDFQKALDDAIMDSSDVHQNMMLQLLSDPTRNKMFSRVVFDLLTGAGKN